MSTIYAAVVDETELGQRVFFVAADVQDSVRSALVTMFPDLSGCRATLYKMPVGFAEALGLAPGQAAEWPVGSVVHL